MGKISLLFLFLGFVALAVGGVVRNQKEFDEALEAKLLFPKSRLVRSVDLAIKQQIATEKEFNSIRKAYYANKKKIQEDVTNNNRGQLTDFKKLKKLGEGSFGKVFKMEHKKTGKIYAVKETKETLEDIRLKKELVKERDIQLGINFPFIVQMDYAWEENQLLYMALDYAPNGDMEYLLSHSKQSISNVKIYAAQITLALAYLHSIRIMHRDLKPENVLLDENWNAKVADFGISKQTQPKLCRAKSFCGTEWYMAPEIKEDEKKEYTKAIDWFALGMLMVQLAGGNIEENDEAFIQQVHKNHKEIEWPTGMIDDADLRDLCTKLLAYNAKDRIGGENHHYTEIMKHPFFSGLDWAGVLKGEVKPEPTEIIHMSMLSRFKNYFYGWQ